VVKNLITRERIMADGMKIIGHTGESLTVTVLAKMGIYAYAIKHDGVDVVAVGGNGLFVAQRIEVKTSEKMFQPEKNLFSFTCAKGKPKRCYTKEDCDMIALVSLLDEKIIFKTVEDVQVITKKVHRKTFLEADVMKKTWEEALSKSLQSTQTNIKDYLTVY
jgi:hypothetical protein